MRIFPSVNAAVWADHQLMERYEWEPVDASAYLLGKQCRAISTEPTVKLIQQLLSNQLGDSRRFDQLYSSAEQGLMTVVGDSEIIFEAFKAGYSEG